MFSKPYAMGFKNVFSISSYLIWLLTVVVKSHVFEWSASTEEKNHSNRGKNHSSMEGGGGAYISFHVRMHSTHYKMYNFGLECTREQVWREHVESCQKQEF